MECSMRQIKEAIAWKVRKDVRINIVGKSHTNRKNTGEHEGVENMSDNRQNNRQSQRDADGFRYEEDPLYWASALCCGKRGRVGILW